MTMKTRIATILLAATFLLAFSPAPSYGQGYVPTPVTVSKEKVKINGKTFYSHVVLEKQTLYSISKAYQVSVDDIYAANPTLHQTGLQKNSIILIPAEGEVRTETVTQNPVKETNATAKVETPAEPEPQTPEYIEHTVKWYEGIDDIARKYGVTVDDIVNFNGLSSRKLTRKQVLRIPLHPGAAPQKQEETPQTPVEVIKEVLEDITTPSQPVEEEVTFEGKKVVDASLLLPLNASGRPSDINMDFYAGVLLAIRDLEKQGIGTRLNVYDVANGVIPSQETLSTSDFVLGPISSKDLALVLDRTGGHVPVISPLDPKAGALTGSHPNMIQAPSPSETQFEALAEWIAETRKAEDKVIVLSEKNVANAPGNALLSKIQSRGLGATVLSYSLSEGTSIPSRLTGMLTKNGTNRIVVASDRQSFMNDVTRNVGILVGKGYDIVLYAPSKVRTFDIDNASYHLAQLHICSTYFVDYSDKDVKNFLLSYRALYNTEPSQFAFQGYDTAKYFIGIVSKYGKNWRRKLEETEGKGLHSDFRFNGQTNAAVRRIVYRKDYTTGLEK